MYTWVWLQQTSDIMDAFCRFLEIRYNVVLLYLCAQYQLATEISLTL